MKTIVIPPENSTAEFYAVGIENPLLGNYKKAYFGKPETAGVSFKHLIPGKTYRFQYRLGLRGDWYDINSESRSKMFTMPSVGKCVCPYEFQIFTFVELFLRRFKEHIFNIYVYFIIPTAQNALPDYNIDTFWTDLL